MNQTFGLANMWAQGDAVTRTVAIILLIMSIVSWVIILTKVLALYKVKKMAKEAIASCPKLVAAIEKEDFKTKTALNQLMTLFEPNKCK